MKVKICGITPKTDLISVLGLFPDYIGFVCYPQSPRYISSEEISKLPLGDHNRGGIKSVGVFVNPTINEIQSYIDKSVFEFIQLHGDEPPSFVEQVISKFPHVKVIKAFRIDNTFSFESLLRYTADLYLFDAASEQFGGSGKPFDWKYLANYTGSSPFLVAGGLGLDNINEALAKFKKHPQCIGVDASSKLEVSPGEKDIRKVEDFIQKVKECR